MVEEQRLGYASTVCPDATPNLSPKGTTAVWDDDHLIFADIRSPHTVENLRHNPAIEINVVDPISRKGYRFKGTATVLTEGILFDEALAFYRRRGVANEIRALTAAGDVTVVPTPGHTPHHVSVIAKADGVSYFLAGDTSYNEALLVQRVPDGVSPRAKPAVRTLWKPS